MGHETADRLRRHRAARTPLSITLSIMAACTTKRPYADTRAPHGRA
jgi:hypothetical protein